MSRTARNSLKLSFMTMVSRVLGLVRDHYQAVFFGTGPIAAFWEIAYMLPNMLRNLLAEGVLSQSFIPIYSEALKNGKTEAAQTAGAIIGFLILFLTGIVAAGIAVFPVFLPIYVGKPLAEIGLLLYLSQVLFGFILAVSLTAIFSGIAQTHEHFIFPSLSPILLNITFISGFLALLAFDFEQSINAKILGWVVLIGGFLQLLVQIGYVATKGWMPKIHLNLKDRSLRRIFSLMGPAVLGASVFQLNQLMDIALASYFIENTGAIPALRFAHRLIQLPTGIIGVALSTTILPALSALIRSGKNDQSATEVVEAVGFALFLTLPAAIGFIFLGPWIIHLLFHGGEWTVYSTYLTWSALQFYAIAIPIYSCNKILTSSFYAYQDTKTPVKILFITVVVNLISNLILIHSLEQGGLALSTAISSTVNFVLLNRALKKKMGNLPYKELARSLIRLLPAIIVLIGLLLTIEYISPYPLTNLNTDQLPVVSYRQAIVVVVGGVGFGAVFYLLIAYFSKATQIRIITDAVSKKLRK
ncbi:MAG: murein biosynthesis integral membrane protein MurJ [Leptonema sp. (in: Bacteria)]|nr:murein biosynthesis integral membrane protein MurJ [Leptonema sp. (in: bacteria)]